MKKLFLLLPIFYTPQSFSLEVDNFGARQAELSDAQGSVEAFLDSYIDAAVKEMSQVGSCDSKRFVETLHAHVGGWTTRIESDIDATSSIDKFKPPTRNSIYGDFNVLEGKLMLLKPTLGSSIRVNDLYIGTDKLGHFLDTGYRYYEIYSSEGNSLSDAIDWGKSTEIGQYGYAVSGIYSYADLAANYEGWRFWVSFIDPDLVGIEPYATCEQGVWQKVRSFDIWEYLSPAWDEGINCNDYLLDSAAKKVNKAIRALGYSCPIEQSSCYEITDRYAETANHVISPSCSSEDPVENLLSLN